MTYKFIDRVMQKVGGAIVRSIPMSELKNISIPLPPLSTQQEIVTTLDTFESYITKLERMISLREKQYEYYREKLLSFE